MALALLSVHESRKEEQRTPEVASTRLPEAASMTMLVQIKEYFKERGEASFSKNCM